MKYVKMKLIATVTHQRKIHFLWQQKRLLVYFTQSSYSELSHSFTGRIQHLTTTTVKMLHLPNGAPRSGEGYNLTTGQIKLQ